jgi:hypothetical protein
MVDQSLVQSGFDIEVLLSARYLSYALLAQIEAGRLPLELDLVDAAAGVDVHITIHPPTDYERLYDPEAAAVLPAAADGSFATALILDDPTGANLQLSVLTDVLDNSSGQGREGVSIGLMLAVRLERDVDDRGFESNHQLAIALVQLDPLTQLELELAGLPVDEVTAQIKTQIDRTIPFGVANGQSVQRAVLSVLSAGDGRDPALGAYVNLALKNGPEADAFVPDRGDVADAVNFLDNGRDIAFATAERLFGLLGDDQFFRMAEEDPPGSGNFRHPLREVPGDPTSDEIGTLTSVSIGPERTPLGGIPTGRLLIDVSGEHTVGFHLLITLRPVIDNGLLTWDIDASVDVGILGSVLGILAIVAGTILLGPGVGITLFTLLLGADLIVDAVASAAAADRADELADASFLDALPHRVVVATRRWDPLYDTHHQVVGLLDRFDITLLGLAFDGTAVLGKEPAPAADAVIRDEERDDTNAVTGLHYRVPNLAAIAPDLAAVAPGTDRLPFTEVDPTADARNEPNLIALTIDQVQDRIHSQRIIAPILYIPERIHVEDKTIRQLLVLSKREIDEQHDILINAFRAQAGAQIRADQGAQITQQETDRLRGALGREPTQEEIDNAVNARISALVDEQETTYEQGPLAADLNAAIAQVLRFDLVPGEFAVLQDDDILAIAGKEIIRMRSGTVYYRDHPDGFVPDNLLALRHYRLPYMPPAT